MSLKTDIDNIKNLEQGITNNKVSKFAYTDTAYTNNDVNGVQTYNINNEQNIPVADADVLQVNTTITNKGYRAQASSLTRMLVNHFFGRVSYNLNKINDFFLSFLTSFSSYLGQPNGVATLDVDGRIPYSQLPETAVEYKGEWNAETNTPTLVDGIGIKGDMYYVSTDGTQNLGSGAIVFFAGDRIIYNGSIWQKLSGGSVKKVNNIRPDDTGNVQLTGENIQVSTTDDTLLSKFKLRDIFSPLLGRFWTQSNITSGNFRVVTYANGIWVAGSSNTGLYYSQDGITWTQSNITSGYFRVVTYANGIWVAGSTVLYYSQDGKTWTQSNITSGYFNVVTYANGIWVAGSSGNGLYYSQDGITWTQSNITSGYFNVVTYANGIWVAGSSSNTGLYYSQDGITWTQSNITSSDFNVVTYANGIWVAGSSNTGLYYSQDGKTWTQSNITSGNFRVVTYANGIWVAGSAGLYYSQDGKTWTQSNITSGNFSVVTYANGIWVAGSSNSNTGLYYSDINTLIKNDWLVLSE